MKKLALALLLLFPLPAFAEATLGIVATVNDDAISNADVDGRMRLALLGAGIRPNAEAQAQLRAQILRALIDERLQLQEATRSGIEVEDAQINAELAELAKRNNQKPEQLPAFFARNGVPMSALREQVRASIAWAMVVQRKLRSRVNISENEIDAEIARLSAAAGQPEYLLAEIFLPVQNPQQDSSVKQTAFRLIDQMAKGVRFSSVAREFSQAPSAARGGDLGWMRVNQLETELAGAISKMSPGTLSPPIRTASGYTILMLREQRLLRLPGVAAAAEADAKLTLRQIILPLAPSASASALEAASRRLEGLRGQVKSCADMERIAAAQGDTSKGDLGTVKLADLPPVLQPVLAALPENKASAPLRNDRGVLFLMICKRDQPAGAGAGVDRQAIANALGAQRLELQARRLLQDLRQDAFIDIRG
jgi:peptidyl-prolyl cis-trans isomerase SurA